MELNYFWIVNQNVSFYIYFSYIEHHLFK